MRSRFTLRLVASLLGAVALLAARALITGAARSPVAAFASLVGMLAAAAGVAFCLNALNRSDG